MARCSGGRYYLFLIKILDIVLITIFFRISRGEIEMQAASMNEFKFKLELNYLNEKNFFRIQYNPVKDVYSYLKTTLTGWKNGVFKQRSLSDHLFS